MPTLPGFVGQAYTSRSLNVSADRLVNLYVEQVESGTGKAPAVLYGTPGLRRLCTVPASPCRGLYTTAQGRVFGIWGSGLYEISAAFAATLLGTVGGGSGPVSLADNGLMLVVVDGSAAGWTYDLTTNTFAAITDDAFYGADTVQVLDTYVLFNRPGTQEFYIWGPEATPSTPFDGTEITSVEGTADLLLALLVDHRELWAFGQQTTEVYFNSGNADFPFERIQGAFIEHGLAAVHSVAKMDNSVFWLGADDRGQGMVWRAQGYTPQRVSTHAIEYALSTYSTIADAEAYTYQQGGHSIYQISLSAGNATWCYDASNNTWFEKAALDTVTGTLNRHRSRGFCMGFGLPLVGDYQSGALYTLDPNTYDDDGAPLKRLRTTPHIHQDMKRLFLSTFELDLESGGGLDGGVIPGTDPQLMLRISRDGAHTWSSEYRVSAGKLGEFRQRARWRRLGSGRDIVLEVSQTDPVKTVWLGASLDVTGGTS